MPDQNLSLALAIIEANLLNDPDAGWNFDSQGANVVAHALRTVLADYERVRGPWRPTHRHRERGSDYRVEGELRVQTARPITDDEVLIVYRGEDGRLWGRLPEEFEDGRFEEIEP